MVAKYRSVGCSHWLAARAAQSGDTGATLPYIKALQIEKCKGTEFLCVISKRIKLGIR
jgi:hypothetical protein